MSMMSRCLILIISALSLSACSLFTPARLHEPATYMLGDISDSLPSLPVSGPNILVVSPDTQTVYNTTLMAYTKKPYEVAYFAQNAWAETPSQMLHPLMVEALQKSHHFHAVVTPPYTGRYDYLLATHIIELVQDFTTTPAMVHLIVRAELSRVNSNRVIATRVFAIDVPMRCKGPYYGVLAATEATQQYLAQLTQFAVAHTR